MELSCVTERPPGALCVQTLSSSLTELERRTGRLQLCPQMGGPRLCFRVLATCGSEHEEPYSL